MAQKQPAAGEDTLQLLLVDVAFDEDTPADQTVLGVDQTLHVCHHDSPPYALWYLTRTQLRRDQRKLVPASAVMTTPVMPLALALEASST